MIAAAAAAAVVARDVFVYKLQSMFSSAIHRCGNAWCTDAQLQK
jgi:hypothetical protein